MSVISRFISKNGPEIQALFRGGIPGFLTALRPGPVPDGVPVFCYHLADREEFGRDLRFLAENRYRTASADDLLDYLERRRDLPEKSVVLSFDDGAVNFYRVAFPLLREYGFRAVFFISPGLHRPASEETDTEERPCTWEELEEMHRSGAADIQSHTWVHRSLTRWPEPIPLRGIGDPRPAGAGGGEFSLEEDLRRSRETLERRFGKPVRHLAWPCYSASEAARQVALSVGYRAFWVGTLPGRPLNRAGQSPEEIVRLSGEFLRRLPGRGRASLAGILGRRYFLAAKTNLARFRAGGLEPGGGADDRQAVSQSRQVAE